jgi:hypothetical protein
MQLDELPWYFGSRGFINKVLLTEINMKGKIKNNWKMLLFYESFSTSNSNVLRCLLCWYKIS